MRPNPAPNLEEADILLHPGFQSSDVRRMKLFSIQEASLLKDTDSLKPDRLSAADMVIREIHNLAGTYLSLLCTLVDCGIPFLPPMRRHSARDKASSRPCTAPFPAVGKKA